MLTDMIVEEEFEIKDEEPWYDHQDLQHDLHLAAELGKTLLDRNRELEQGLQQMYTTNQEQLQEIEYLTKQVDLLRQMNEQHAKVYEQLDMTARDLEQGNQRLVMDNRMAQQKIQGLTETIEGLQTQVEELQQQVEELKAAQSDYAGGGLAEQRQSLSAHSVPCLKELHDMHKYLQDHALLDSAFSLADGIRAQEENTALKRSVQTLQSQLTSERTRRKEVETEAELMARENGELEQRLAELEGNQAWQRELEVEVEELRQLWRSDTASARRADKLLPDSVFFPPEERVEQEGEQEAEAALPEQGRHVLKRCSSESMLRSANAEEMRRGHERSCVRRAAAVKQRGISLLNEVDAQYSALQVKYDELLRRCQEGAEQQSHKAVQTPGVPRRHSSAVPCLQADDDNQQPEYKALFQEIFTCIQKTKEDLSGNRARLSQAQ
ncbi:cerebellar degeneration-related protein 2-like [Megalops cyprinoides]|uniref:cerebellar degeneration-related protein 2-like n=1 Tax=Megalops cyprinoides TaxID=118141 RepID=UPI001863AEDB|nr:cerebellar degeneration-related protein 2-like [Megalops cyprinoides]